MNSALLSITIALLFGIGTFLILRKDLIKIVIGLSILSHAVNMLIVSTGLFENGKVPIITGEHAEHSSGIVFTDDLANSVLAPVVPESAEMIYVDPLVQALVLTAIVISLATTAFILILAYRIYEEYGTTDISKLRRLWG
ncbi:multicomponent Na+:H+ antiporter subunit C [Methanohalophilus levihalophilus]|uniref:NADH-quinone oxidoreductase subunit K n=1 Tax=Methanohalophilus levihalophilus TaxID=1431282 RepID=UPI001AE602E1|nr:NADH-quinone oxidoreductase subunit K [Methanohalophilus levihalophilus]MBP2031298.1 multicomponent Na+:H+ antiporter subunit C [Methanohalophilus levihalophilus]